MLNKKIEYSRHARRRMQLYNISEEDVSSIVEQNSLAFAVQRRRWPQPPSLINKETVYEEVWVQ